MIVNFCKNFTETKVLPKRALDALTSVVEDTSSACIARRVLLLHLTKVVEQAELIGFFFYEAAKMSVRSVNTDDEIEWLHLAAKVIQHEQVIICVHIPIPVLFYVHVRCRSLKESRTVLENLSFRFRMTWNSVT